MSQSEQPKPATKVRRVKTGCKTCKKRRVKCDEARPACRRCLTAGLQCGGYGIWDSLPGHNELVPSASNTLPRLDTQTSGLSRHNIPIPVHCCATDDRCYFDFFHFLAKEKLPSVFDSRFWERLVFQVSSSEPPVLRAALALSAMYRSKDQELHRMRMQCPDQADSASQDEEFAQRTYVDCLGDLRARLQKQDAKSLQVSLMMCIMLTTFELFKGDYGAAKTHMASGLILSQQVMRCRDQCDDGKHLLEPFLRFSMQSAVFHDAPTHLENFRISNECVVPARFQNLAEARHSLDWLLIEAQKLSQYCRISTPDDASTPDAGSILQGKQRCLEKTASAWIEAYDACLPQLLERASRRTIYGVHMLRIFYTVALIIIRTCLSAPLESVFDQHVGMFASLIEQVMKLWDMTRFAVGMPFEGNGRVSGPRVTLDIGIIPALYYTALKCRESRLRRQAISLLKLVPYREGIWDSRVVAHLAKTVVEAEEGSRIADSELGFDSLVKMDEHDIMKPPAVPESSRFHYVRVALQQDSGARGTLWCSKFSLDCDEGWLTTIIDFDFTPISTSR